MRSQLLGPLFEHVLNRKLEVLFGLAVLGLLSNEVVLFEAFLGETDHGVDHGQPVWSGHCHSDHRHRALPGSRRLRGGAALVLGGDKNPSLSLDSETVFSFLSTP